jgi:hypothetical protein
MNNGLALVEYVMKLLFDAGIINYHPNQFLLLMSYVLEETARPKNTMSSTKERKSIYKNATLILLMNRSPPNLYPFLSHPSIPLFHRFILLVELCDRDPDLPI